MKGGQVKITAKLENWNILHNYPSFFTLRGQIVDDVEHRWPNGTAIHTSSLDISQLENLREGGIIKTRYSTYLLGKEVSFENTSNT